MTIKRCFIIIRSKVNIEEGKLGLLEFLAAKVLL